MKFRIFPLILSFFLINTNTFASNVKIHPHVQNQNAAQSTEKPRSFMPGCNIEIRLGKWADSVWVYGFFDDYTALQPFLIKWYDSSHFIDLYYGEYGGYCHEGMLLYIETDGISSRKYVFSGYVPVNSIIKVQRTPLTSELEASVHNS